MQGESKCKRRVKQAQCSQRSKARHGRARIWAAQCSAARPTSNDRRSGSHCPSLLQQDGGETAHSSTRAAQRRRQARVAPQQLIKWRTVRRRRQRGKVWPPAAEEQLESSSRMGRFPPHRTQASPFPPATECCRQAARCQQASASALPTSVRGSHTRQHAWSKSNKRCAAPCLQWQQLHAQQHRHQHRKCMRRWHRYAIARSSSASRIRYHQQTARTRSRSLMS